MNRNDCKIIQDLLPNYIDGLTNEHTNEFIKEHLSKCESCKAKYNDMNEQLDLDYKADDKEIKSMEKVHKRIITMGIVILVLSVIIAICIYINYQMSHLLNPKTGKAYGLEIEATNDRYLYIKYNSNYNDINIDTTAILTLDINNICKNTRIVENSNNTKGRQSIETKYNMIKETDKIYNNAELKDDKLYYNYNKWNGLSKETILNQLKEYELNIKEY